MSIFFNRLAIILAVALALLLTIGFFPFAAVYFMVTGKDVSGRFLP